MNRMIPLIIAAMLLFTAGTAPAAKTGSLAGRVLDADTGQGVDDVQVVAELGAWEFRGITDSEGRYRIADLKPGTYRIWFIPTRTQHVKPAKAQAEVTVKAGKQETAVDAVLPRGCFISGTVYSEKKKITRPLPNAVVGFDIVDPRPEWGVRYGSVKSDSRGFFEFNGLPSTREFLLSVKVNGHADIRKSMTLDSEKNSDLAVTITWNDLTGVSGTVRTLPDRRGIADVTVLLKDSSGEHAGRAVTNYYGEFSIVGMAPGNYTATAYWQGGDPVGKQVVIQAGLSSPINFEFKSPDR